MTFAYVLVNALFVLVDFVCQPAKVVPEGVLALVRAGWVTKRQIA